MLGGAIVPGGAALRGSTTWLPRTQSGPLRCMHSGWASGRLSARSVTSAAMAGAMLASNTIIDAEIRVIDKAVNRRFMVSAFWLCNRSRPEVQPDVPTNTTVPYVRQHTVRRTICIACAGVQTPLEDGS